MGHTDLYFRITGPSLYLRIPWMNKRRKERRGKEEDGERGGSQTKQKQASVKLQNSLWGAQKDDTHIL